MQTIKNLFPKIYDFENLLEAYKAAIKSKRYRPDVMEYADKLEENLFDLQNNLIWGLYEVGHYHMFYVYEPKKRLIMSLQFKDRVAQHAIYRQLNPLIEKQYIKDSYACRVGYGTHAAIDRLQGWMRQTERKPEKYYYLKLDVSKYFYRIDHEILKNILARQIKDKQLLDLLAKIIDCEDTRFGLPMGADIGDVAFDEMLFGVGLPIGNLTSQMFANLYLNELDQYCKHKLRIHYYIRYMDDVIILHNNKKELETMIEKDLQEHKIESWRAEILDFANSCMNHRRHTKEEFNNFFKAHDNYEIYVKENGLENGCVDAAFKYVEQIYLHCAETNDFLADEKAEREGDKKCG